jgi:hypothetical protein
LFRHAWNILQQQLHRIEDEIAVKSNSIMLEKRALETRRRLNTEITPNTETDFNLQNKIEKNIFRIFYCKIQIK